MDDQRLSEVLSVLGSPTRLAILRALRRPQTVSEIEVRSDEGPEVGHIARQTVTKHLDRLREVGLVTSRDISREGRDAVEFSLSHQALFSLSDDLRALARMRPAVEPEVMTTPAAAMNMAQAKGPCLVVVRGLEEGIAYSLLALGDRREWIVGRRRDAAVPLDYDPHISSRHTRVSWTGTAYTVEDLGSRNGTYVNFRLLSAGEKRTLRHGDLVGVGRCLLLYWA